MLTCKDFLKEVSDFLDDKTDPALKKELEAHVNECPNCWVVLDTTKKTLRVFKGMTAQVLPEGVHSRLMAALEKRIAAKKKCAPAKEHSH